MANANIDYSFNDELSLTKGVVLFTQGNDTIEFLGYKNNTSGINGIFISLINSTTQAFSFDNTNLLKTSVLTGLSGNAKVEIWTRTHKKDNVDSYKQLKQQGDFIYLDDDNDYTEQITNDIAIKNPLYRTSNKIDIKFVLINSTPATKLYFNFELFI
jgi:hypothetical protein